MAPPGLPLMSKTRNPLAIRTTFSITAAGKRKIHTCQESGKRSMNAMARFGKSFSNSQSLKARKMIMSWTLYMTGKSPASASFPPFFESHPFFMLPLVSVVKQMLKFAFSSFSSSYGYNNGEPYTIHFFLGPVDGKPSLYGKHPNHIDILYTFSSQLATVQGPSEGESTPKCKNCAEQKAGGVLSKGQIILTNALLKDATDANNSDLNSLEPDDVNRYLKEHLNWRAVDVSFHPPSSPAFYLLALIFNPLGVSLL